MTAAPRLFLDASVFIAAAGSDTGASALTLALGRQGHATPLASRRVLLEAERNIRIKLGSEALLRFYEAIAATDLVVVESPTPEEIAAHHHIIDPKDAHVLAAALKGAADVLLTLDRRHFMTPAVQGAGLPFLIMTPGEWLRRWLAT